jgi:serine/threonine-protein kinase haspin
LHPNLLFGTAGDYQFDIYRIMREHNGGEWEGYKPLTNVMVCPMDIPVCFQLIFLTGQWLHYLSLKLLHSKRLKVPTTAKTTMRTPKKPTPSRSTWTEKECYECLVEVEAELSVCVDACRPKKGKGKGSKKTKSPGTGTRGEMGCAGDVRRWGIGKGWVR